MHVLQIVADGNPGGGSTHLLQIVSRLSGTYRLTLIAQTNSYLLHEASVAGIASFGVNFFRNRVDLSVPIRLRRVVRELKPDLVHVHGGRAAFFCALAKLKVPIVYTVHAYHCFHKPPFSRCLAIQAERRAGACAHHVIFVSNHDLRLAENKLLVPKDVRKSVIPCGIAMLQCPRAVPTPEKHVGFIGRAEEQKDPLLFLDVMERLAGYKATIIGGGTLDRKVRAEIERRGLSRVCVLGAMPHQKTLSLLATFAVLVMTSKWEGLPITCLEAMAVGVPVVATNVGGLEEAIENGRSGILLNSRSPKEIADAVRRVAENQRLRDEIVKEARERVDRLFSEEMMLRSIEEIYHEVVT